MVGSGVITVMRLASATESKPGAPTVTLVAAMLETLRVGDEAVSMATVSVAITAPGSSTVNEVAATPCAPLTCAPCLRTSTAAPLTALPLVSVTVTSILASCATLRHLYERGAKDAAGLPQMEARRLVGHTAV